MISLFCILLCLSITSKLRPPTLASPTVHWSVGVLAGLLLVRNDQSRVGHQSEESAAWRRGEQGEIILLVQCSSGVKNCCIQNIVGRHGFQVPGLGGCKGVIKLYILRSDPTWLCYFQGFHKTVYMTHNNIIMMHSLLPDSDLVKLTPSLHQVSGGRDVECGAVWPCSGQWSLLGTRRTIIIWFDIDIYLNKALDVNEWLAS